MTFNGFFARRYALGGTLLALLLLLFTAKFAWLAFDDLIEPAHYLGLLRFYALVVILFIPWFLLTLLTRLRVESGRVIWRKIPFQREFGLQDISAIERIDARYPDSVPNLAINYRANDSVRRVTLTPYTFPKGDFRAFLKALGAERPDLTLPELNS